MESIHIHKLKQSLSVWTKLSSNTRVRDRSIKILQYGCQMLIGYYGAQLTTEVVQSLKHARSIASTSRKAFWLLKSINHVYEVIQLIEDYDLVNDECYANLLDIIEQFFLIIYYAYENLVFIARTKLVSFTEKSFDGWVDWAWFLEDFAGFLAALMKTYISCRNLAKGIEAFRSNATSVAHITEATHKIDIMVDQHARSHILQDLRRKYSDSALSFVIASLELGASAESVGLFRKVLGVSIGDTGMGLCGVASSVLILYEAAICEMRKESEEVNTVEP